MKLRVLSLLWSLASSVMAGPTVTNLVLNPREVVVVPVATDRLSTVRFPSPLSQIEAAFVSVEGEPPARFQLSFRPGQSFFSVRALGTNLAACVNVVWRTNTYVFELVPSSHPILSLTLVEPVRRDLRMGTQAPTAHRLLGILDTANAYALLRTQHPHEVGDVQYAPRRDRYDFGSYDIVLEEVFHFQSEDTLVFRVMLHNKAEVPLRYLPQTFRVRVGQHTFPAAIADGEGTVPALSRAPVYFAVTSTPDGSRPSLSLNNDFVVLVSVPTPPEKPATEPKRGLLRFLKRP